MASFAGGRVFIQKAIKKVSCLTVAVLSML